MEYDVQQCIGARMRRLSRIVDAYYKTRLAKFGITESQVTILFLLNKILKIEQGKIAKLLSLERSTISRNISLLEKKGFVIKTKNYRPIVKLTKEGQLLVQEILPVWNEVMIDLVKKIGEDGFHMIEDLEVKLNIK